jgi:hypothetical protein
MVVFDSVFLSSLVKTTRKRGTAKANLPTAPTMTEQEKDKKVQKGIAKVGFDPTSSG